MPIEERLIIMAISGLLVLAGNFPSIRESKLSVTLRSTGYIVLLLNMPYVDMVSSILILGGVLISVSLTGFSLHYSKIKYETTSLVVLIDIFALAILFTFSSKFLIELITFWLLTELLGFFLIAYDSIIGARREAMNSALKYLLFSMIPTDVALFILLALTGFNKAARIPIHDLFVSIDSPILTALVIIGFFSKAAIFPLHFWLPDAHSIAPAPASSLLSGLMVKMGIYGLYLVTKFNMNKEAAFLTLLIPASITAIYGGLQASIQHDIKRILAYSTTSHMAVMVLLLFLYMLLGDKIFVYTLMIYALAHIIYKAGLFADSGLVEVLTHERVVERLGYVSRIVPLETLAVILLTLSMLGMPPTVGFLAKLLLFTSISHYLTYSWIYLAILLIISIEISLTVLYSIRYLKVHITSKDIINLKKLNLKALTMKYYVALMALISIIITFTLSIFETLYVEEIKLLGEIIPVLYVSLAMLLFISLPLYELFRVEK
ncbi:MAG: hypothetical protein DRO23_01370 [Thermoprotei archaeon]|mgnify:CR=1 FL=1|nr:MAG: hypothetical protein DRO23_01370 [Thermoprotei archaeon]